MHKLVEKANVVREDWNGYNVLHDSASRVAALDLGFLPSARAAASKTKPKFVYLLGSDDFQDTDVPEDAFVVYQVQVKLKRSCVICPKQSAQANSRTFKVGRKAVHLELGIFCQLYTCNY